MRSAPGAGKTVALTFDDGPTAYTPQVLRILRKNNVRATFFMTGRHAASRQDVVALVADEGHLLAGHTYDHDYPTQVSGGWTRSYIADQFRRTNRLLSPAAGRPICFFRPPGGYQTSGMYDAARATGTAVVMWSVDSEDWKQPGATTAAATRNIVARATAGGAQQHPLVLFHDGKASHEPESQVSSNRSNTVVALPRVISYYRSHGYRFVDLTGASGLRAESTVTTVSASPSRVPAATRSVLKGRVVGAVSGPVADREVVWFSRPVGTGSWSRRGTTTTESTGSYRVDVQPATDTEYRFRLSASQRFRTSSAVEAVATYTLPTQVRVTGPSTVTEGEAVVLQISVTSEGVARPGVTVAVSRSVDGEVITDRLTVDASGRVAYTDEPTDTTRYTIRVPQDLPHEAGSAVHDVDVAPSSETDPG